MDKKECHNSSIVKAKLLSYGYRLSADAEKLIDKNVKEEHRGYGDSHWGTKKDTKVPCELLLPGEIVVATHLRPESQLELVVRNNKLYITENKKALTEVNYLKRPSIWGMYTKSGINMKKIANFYGRDCLNFNIYSGCEFWDDAVPCRFCSVAPTQVKYKEVEIKKTPELIREVAQAAFNSGDKIDFVIVTGGSYLDGDAEINKHIPVLKAIGEVVPKEWNGKIKGNVALMVPQTIEKLDELMATGIEHPSFNLEVWGEKYFKYVCPGKAKYRTWDHIMKTYDYGVQKFGKGVFWVNFVGGLNRLSKLKEGFTFMAQKGVVPGSNIFHPDVGSYLGYKRYSPSVDYILELNRHAAKLYHKYNLHPFFNEKVLRNSLANEAYLGYI
jgi:hypothetical protein